MEESSLPLEKVHPSQTVLQKDATELELERLVFGDSSGFLEGLRSYQAGIGVELVLDGGESTYDGRDVPMVDADLGGLKDADVSEEAAIDSALTTLHSSILWTRIPQALKIMLSLRMK